MTRAGSPAPPLVRCVWLNPLSCFTIYRDPTNDYGAKFARRYRIVITAQGRDTTQRDLRIDYVLRPEPATVLSLWTMAGLTGLALLAGLLIRLLRSGSKGAF